MAKRARNIRVSETEVARVKNEAKSFIESGEFTTVKLSDIRLWPDNPRKNEKAVGKLKKILKEHGQRTPLSVWIEDMTIYKGNTTYKAMKELGWEECAVLLMDFPSKAAAAAYALADNKASEWSGWDAELLSRLMKSEEIDIASMTEATGFTDKEIKSYLMGSEDLPEGLKPIDLQGNVDGKSDFVVVQFSSPEERQLFLQCMDIKAEHQRVIPFEKLIESMPSMRDKMLKFVEDKESRPTERRARRPHSPR